MEFRAEVVNELFAWRYISFFFPEKRRQVKSKSWYRGLGDRNSVNIYCNFSVAEKSVQS